jgi:hypothetical protein
MSQPAATGSRTFIVPAAVGIIGLALIGIGQTGPNRHAIEDDLTNRSTEALRSAGLGGISVSFSGRDADLTGTGSRQVVDRALAVVRDVQGVRVAEGRVTGVVPAAAAPADPASTPEPAAAPAATPSAEPPPTPVATTPEAAESAPLPVAFTLDGGTITATGSVPSDPARTDLIGAVRAAGHGWKVVDRLDVNAAVTAPAPAKDKLPAVTTLLAGAPIDGSKLVIQYKGETVILRGAPANGRTEQALLAAAAASVDASATVVDGLDVAGP